MQHLQGLPWPEEVLVHFASFAYNAAGRACSASSSLTARWGTLTLEHGGNTRNIKINMLGRVRVCDPDRDGSSCGNAAD